MLAGPSTSPLRPRFMDFTAGISHHSRSNCASRCPPSSQLLSLIPKQPGPPVTCICFSYASALYSTSAACLPLIILHEVVWTSDAAEIRGRKIAPPMKESHLRKRPQDTCIKTRSFLPGFKARRRGKVVVKLL